MQFQVGPKSLGHLPATKHKFVVVAHRGDHTATPENTLAAFKNAIDANADYVEIDLRTTKDSQLIIMHDASADRMTDGRGWIKDLTIADLDKLKVQDKKHPEWGTYKIPTFREVLELCKNRINIYLDFKNANPAVAYDQLKEFGMEKNVVVYINEEKQFYQWRKVDPEIPLMVSLPDQIKNAEGVRTFLNKTLVPVLDGSYRQYNSEMVQAAKENGSMVLPDIQQPNERPDLWDSAISTGIYGLQTDHPAALIAYLIQKQLR